MRDALPQTDNIGRDRAATERRILNAARTVFTERGYDAAGLREIADGAQANLSLISRYFGGKEGLLIALTDQFVAARREGDLSYPPQTTLADEIYHYLHDKLQDDLKHQGMIRLLVSRAAIDEAYRGQSMHNMDGKADANFRARIEALQDKGAVSTAIDIDLLFAAVLHFSFSVNFFGSMIADRPRDEIDALFRAFSDALASGFPH